MKLHQIEQPVFDGGEVCSDVAGDLEIVGSGENARGPKQRDDGVADKEHGQAQRGNKKEDGSSRAVGTEDRLQER